MLQQSPVEYQSASFLFPDYAKARLCNVIHLFPPSSSRPIFSVVTKYLAEFSCLSMCVRQNNQKQEGSQRLFSLANLGRFCDKFCEIWAGNGKKMRQAAPFCACVARVRSNLSRLVLTLEEQKGLQRLGRRCLHPLLKRLCRTILEAQDKTPTVTHSSTCA